MKMRDSKFFAGDIIKCARINNNLTQMDLAKNLNWSQGYVSKIESGKLIPDAFEWMALSELFNFPADSLRWGYIDNLKDVEFNSNTKENGFSLPKEYRLQKCMNLRFATPFLSADSSKDSRLFLKDHKIDPAFQSNLSHQINLNLLDKIIEINKNNKDFLSHSAQAFSDQLSHGKLWDQYNTGNQPFGSLKKLAKNMRKYQLIWDFDYSAISSENCEVSIMPNKDFHDERIINNRSQINKFIDNYWSAALVQFNKSTGQKPDETYKISPITSYTNGDDAWRFNVSIA